MRSSDIAGIRWVAGLLVELPVPVVQKQCWAARSQEADRGAKHEARDPCAAQRARL